MNDDNDHVVVDGDYDDTTAVEDNNKILLLFY